MFWPLYPAIHSSNMQLCFLETVQLNIEAGFEFYTTTRTTTTAATITITTTTAANNTTKIIEWLVMMSDSGVYEKPKP